MIKKKKTKEDFFNVYTIQGFERIFDKSSAIREAVDSLQNYLEFF